jgi:Spy/CpxP family protein refolding chaperone
MSESHRFPIRILPVLLLGVSLLLASPVGLGAVQEIDAPVPSGRDLPPTNRLDILAVSLGLTKEQKTTVKAQIDEAHKSAAPVRARLAPTRAAMVTAVREGRPQGEIDAAVAAHAAEITAMTQLEVKALAGVLAALTPDQQARARANGIRAAFFLFRGIFLDDRRWNVEPATAGY